MQLILTLRSPKERFTLPLSYNHYLQGALYHLLSRDVADFLHNRGYAFEKRVFRFFSFSRLLGPYEVSKKEGRITFQGSVKLVIASPILSFLEGALNALVGTGTIRLGPEVLFIEVVETKPVEIDGDRVVVQTLSPVTVYSTLYSAEGKPHTIYHKPSESRFRELIEDNLRKKFIIAREQLGMFADFPEEQYAFHVRPFRNMKKALVSYQNILIEAYSGRMELKGPADILKFAVEVSLGGKNAQGFGCIMPV